MTYPTQEVLKRFREQYKEAYKDILPPEVLEQGNEWFESFLTAEVERAYLAGEEGKNGAYQERDMLVWALSKLFPAHLARHSDEDKDWEDDWRWIVYVQLPTGQVSWHIHDSERDMFDHLKIEPNEWDGHNTERKYQRLQALTDLSARHSDNPT